MFLRANGAAAGPPEDSQLATRQGRRSQRLVIRYRF